MKPELYERFLMLRNSGRKPQAKVALDEFINSFENFEEKAVWVREFLDTEEFGHKVRHEIYEHLVFPVLLAGYEQKEAWSLLNLAKTSKNLYASKSLHAAVDFKSEFQFLTEAYEIEPTEELRKQLLGQHIRGFSFSQHEWPIGIIFEGRGDDLDECEILFKNVEAARKLDTKNQHEAFFDDFVAKVEEYKLRLQQRKNANQQK